VGDRWVAGLLVAVAVLLTGCASADPYVELLDALELPDGWERTSRDVQTVRNDGCSIMGGHTCPQVVETYDIDAEPADALAQAKDAAASLGLEPVEGWGDDTCDQPQVEGSNCTVTADDGEVVLQVLIGEAPDGAVAEVRAHQSRNE
jgi:fumarylacetoacetate (FAA) hydrolase family protein